MVSAVQTQLKQTNLIRVMVYEVYFPSEISRTRDIFVDAFYVGSDNILSRLQKVDEVREDPAFRIRDLKVENPSKGIFKVSFTTWDCKNNLQTLKIANAQVSTVYRL